MADNGLDSSAQTFVDSPDSGHRAYSTQDAIRLSDCGSKPTFLRAVRELSINPKEIVTEHGIEKLYSEEDIERVKLHRAQRGGVRPNGTSRLPAPTWSPEEMMLTLKDALAAVLARRDAEMVEELRALRAAVEAQAGQGAERVQRLTCELEGIRSAVERQRGRAVDAPPRPRWSDWLLVGVVVAAVALTAGLLAAIGWQMQQMVR